MLLDLLLHSHGLRANCKANRGFRTATDSDGSNLGKLRAWAMALKLAPSAERAVEGEDAKSQKEVANTW